MTESILRSVVARMFNSGWPGESRFSIPRFHQNWTTKQSVCVRNPTLNLSQSGYRLLHSMNHARSHRDLQKKKQTRKIPRNNLNYLSPKIQEKRNRYQIAFLFMTSTFQSIHYFKSVILRENCCSPDRTVSRYVPEA